MEPDVFSAEFRVDVFGVENPAICAFQVFGS